MIRRNLIFDKVNCQYLTQQLRREYHTLLTLNFWEAMQHNFCLNSISIILEQHQLPIGLNPYSPSVEKRQRSHH